MDNGWNRLRAHPRKLQSLLADQEMRRIILSNCFAAFSLQGKQGEEESKHKTTAALEKEKKNFLQELNEAVFSLEI